VAVLAIDTSVGVAVAVVGPSGQVARAGADEDRKHAELLGPLTRAALAEAGVTPADVTSVVVGTGPAPFTGLRAGIVAARTFAFARGVPVLGVPSLDAAALHAVRLGHASDGEELVVLSDARRREVYHARYRVSGETVTRLTEPAVGRPQGLVADGSLTGAVVVATGQVPALEAVLAELPAGAVRFAGTDATPDPVLLVRLAEQRTADGMPSPTEPLYLRRPDAVVPAASKRVSA